MPYSLSVWWEVDAKTGFNFLFYPPALLWNLGNWLKIIGPDHILFFLDLSFFPPAIR